MKLLVTGAAGMLGGDVVDAALAAGHEAVAVDLPDADLTDADDAGNLVRTHRPDAVIHCAAYTDVDGAEAAEDLAFAVNADAAGNVGRAAAAIGKRIVHVSTDYVFDGENPAGYAESDSPHPLSAYGRSKLAGELKVAASGRRHAVVRSAWLFGPRGGNFVDTMLRLAGEREEVAVVTDQVGSPTYTGHLAPALVEIATSGTRGLIHLTASGHCSWNELAAEVFRQAGVECRVAPLSSKELARPAPRPACSVLRSERDDVPRLPDWREGVAAHLARIGAATPAAEGSGA